MPKWVELKPHLTSEELYGRYERCSDPSEKVRWLALHLVSKGTRAAEAARQVGRTSWWCHALVRRYNERGPKAVPDARIGAHRINAGRKPRLDEETTHALDLALRSAPAEGGAWTASKVARWIKEHTGQSVHDSTAWRAMRRLGYPKPLSPSPKRKSSPNRKAPTAER